LLSIRFSDLDLDKRLLTLTESKTGKRKDIRLNASALDVIQRRRKDHPGDVFLFEVHCNLSRAFKDVGDSLGLNVGTHSMRKSRGKAMFDAGLPIEKIARVLNHASSGVALRYLGISREDVLKTYDDFEL
jgi:integrase